MKSQNKFFSYSFFVAVLLVVYVAFLELSVLLIGLNFINPTPQGSHWEWVYGEDAVQAVRAITTVVFVPGSLVILALAIKNRTRKNRKIAWAVWAFALATIVWTFVAMGLTSSHLVSDSTNSQQNTELRALELKVGN